MTAITTVRATLAAVALIASSTAAPAQNLGSLLGGAGGGSIPGLGSAGIGNAAGLLGYCVKNKLLGGTAGAGGLAGQLAGSGGIGGKAEGAAGAAGVAAAGSAVGSAGGSGGGLGGGSGGGLLGGGAAGLLGKLTGRPGVTSSPGYALGQQGKVEQPGGGALALGGLGGSLKAKACDLVLKRAGSFL